MINFIKINMTLANYSDAQFLATKDSKQLTEKERYMAEALREIPSFWDWVNYMMMLMSSTTYGPATEYRPYIEWINLKGDFAKMPRFVNFKPALIRFSHTLCCIGVYTALGMFIDLYDMVDPKFKQESLWFKIYFMIMC